MAGIGPRFGGRLLDILAIAVLATVVLHLFGDGDRPIAGIFLVAVSLWAYETLSVALFGATPGQAMVGLRVVPLDAAGKPSVAAAARRAAVDAGLAAAVVIGWVVWLVSVAGDPLGRGIPDRNASTMVVPRHTKLPITTTDLPGYADGARPPRVVALGRVGDVDVRVRARLRRFEHRPLMGLLVGLLVVLAPLLSVTRTRFSLVTLAWLVVFTIDETRALARTAGTPGHRIAGLVVLDRRTGLPPSPGRAVARAVALGLLVYPPVLWASRTVSLVLVAVWLLLLLLSLLLMRLRSDGRGLHDLVAGTVVVADPRLSPEAQRQRAMAVRLGRAA